jgi:hypothetical protein
MFRSLLGLCFVALLASGGWLAWRKLDENQRFIQQQQREIAEKSRVIENLSRSSRVAQAVVVDQWTGEDGIVRSKIRFVELGADGEPVTKKTLVVPGREVYFDALVLKFDRTLVGEGDAIKGRSVLLFRRIFGEHQQPSEGVRLDEGEVDGIPDVYRTNAAPSAAEVELWKKFWTFATDPAAAAAAGVRVAQGEAPFTRMEKGHLYELTLDHAGGLNITRSKIPAVLMDEDP